MKSTRTQLLAWRRIVVAPVLFTLVGGCSSLEEYPDPGSVFEATFGARPGPGVAILQAYGRAFGDNAAAYLRLKASPAAFAALTARGFMPIPAAEYQTEIQGGSLAGPIPTWWAPLKDSPTIFLFATRFHPGYSQGQAIVAYDATNQIAKFYWDGSD
jgi:hypothetical protein